MLKIYFNTLNTWLTKMGYFQSVILYIRSIVAVFKNDLNERTVISLTNWLSHFQHWQKSKVKLIVQYSRYRDLAFGLEMGGNLSGKDLYYFLCFKIRWHQSLDSRILIRAISLSSRKINKDKTVRLEIIGNTRNCLATFVWIQW